MGRGRRREQQNGKEGRLCFEQQSWALLKATKLARYRCCCLSSLQAHVLSVSMPSAPGAAACMPDTRMAGAPGI